MKLYLVRHGQTDWNLQDKIQGWADVPLNDAGIKQAERLRDQLHKKNIIPDKVYASPLQRVRSTAKIITDGKQQIIIDERLMERNVGELEGRSCREFFDFEIDFFQDVCYYKSIGAANSPLVANILPLFSMTLIKKSKNLQKRC